MKPWTQSRTVWVNLGVIAATAALAALEMIRDTFELSSDGGILLAGALAGVNLVLRWLTSQPITTARPLRFLNRLRGRRIDKIEALEQKTEAQAQQITRLLAKKD